MTNEEVITMLIDMDRKMSDELYNGRPEQDMPREQTDNIWNNTMPHKVIMEKVKELSKPKIII